MSTDYETIEKNYKAAERALSIALYEMGKTDISSMGTRVTYTVSVPQYFLSIALPVLLKYVSQDSIPDLIKNAQRRALARMVRGWGWWTGVSFLASLPFLIYHFSVALIVFLTLFSACSVSFISRKRLAKLWNERPDEKGTDAIVFEKMIEECKKSKVKLCIEYLFNK